MNFINETMHPQAKSLFDLLESAKNKDFQAHYEVMQDWQAQQGMTDEKASDLYAMLAEKFEAVWTKITAPIRLSGISYCLWSNDRRYPR